MLSPQVRDRAPLPRAAAGRRLLLPPHRHRRHLTDQEQMRRGSRTYQQVSLLFSILYNTMILLLCKGLINRDL